MKPGFALNLSQDGIALLQRSPKGWLVVGETGLEDEGLAERLAALRERALALSPEGITTKLILPNSQILYTAIEAPGPDAASRRAQIAGALENRTPYAVADLVFDWSGHGQGVQVAIVARETLAEAEAFAEEHGFAPLSFVAIPEEGDFAGEPWFGPTAQAPERVPEGGRVDRDQDPVRVVGVAALPEDVPEAGAEAPAAEETLPDPEDAWEAALTAPLEEIAAADAGIPAPGTVVEEPEEPAPASAEAEDLQEPAVPELDEPGVPEADGAGVLPEEEPGAEELAATSEAAAGPPAAVAAEAEAEEPPAARAQTSPGASETLAEPAPLLDEDAAAQELSGPEPAEAAEVEDLPAEEGPAPALADAGAELPEEPAEVAALGAEAAPAEPDPDEAPIALDVTDEGEDQTDAVSAPIAAFASRRLGPALSGPAERAAGVPPRLGIAATDALRAPPRAGVTSPELAVPPPSAPRPAPEPERPAPRGRAPRPAKAARPETLPGGLRKFLSRKSAAPRPAPPQVPPAGTEAEAMTVFGARRAALRGKPRYLGLTLTAILLLFMGAVALWSVFLGEPAEDATGSADPAPASVQTAAFAPEAAEPGALADPAGLEEPAEDAAVAPPEAPAETLAEEEPARPAPEDTLAAAPATPAATQTRAEVVARYSATGVWTLPPKVQAAPGPDAPAGLRFTARDPDPAEMRLAALPRPESFAADPQLGALPLPAPFGSVVEFGPDGLIVPTPEGAITPDGVTLFTGAPALVPPARPGAAEAPGTEATEAEPSASPLTAEAPDPRFEGRRPQTRPAGLAPEEGANAPEPAGTAGTAAAPGPDPAEPVEIAAAPPFADPALAGKTPRGRSAAAETAAREAAARAAAEAEAEATAEAEMAAASRLAVASSRKPASRPRDFSRAVEAALAAAVAVPEPQPAAAAPPPPEPQRVAVARPAPEPEEAEEIDEPEPQAAAPNIPTRASVAKQATIANAINLGKVNLIGVYGSSGNRRALVRLSNGKFVKLKIGDKLDGGKVAAISENQLSYVKNGRTIVLTLLKDS